MRLGLAVAVLCAATVPANADDTRCYAELHDPAICGGVVQGGGRQLACLRLHAGGVTALCRGMLVDRGLVDSTPAARPVERGRAAHAPGAPLSAATPLSQPP